MSPAGGARWRVAGALLGVALLPACRDDGGSAQDLCSALVDTEGISTQLQGFDPTDRDGALDLLRPARVTLGELRNEAPDEVRDDLQVEIDYVQALIEGLERVPAGDPAAAATEVQAVTDAHPGVADAAAELQAFADRECAAANG